MTAIRTARVSLIEPAVRSECIITETFWQIRAALPFLSGFLIRRGHQCRVYCEELVDLGARFGELAGWSDIAGISVTVNTIERGIEIARTLRTMNPGLLIVFGGPVTGNYLETLLKVGDLCIVGRGEGPLVEIADIVSRNSMFKRAEGSARPASGVDNSNRASLFDRIPGVLSRTRQLDDDFVEGIPSDGPSDFRCVEGFGGFSERRNIFGLPKPPLYSIFSSTGCVNRCRFCASSRKFLPRNTETVAADLEDILSRHATLVVPRVMLVDDCPFGSIDHLEALLKRLESIRRRRKFYGLAQFHVAPLIRIPGIAESFARAGITTLMIGFETVDDSTLKAEGKGTTKEQIMKAIQICRKAGIVPYGYFMAGFDGDDETSVRSTFDFILEQRLVAQVLPMGIMPWDSNGKPSPLRDRVLDPFSFGASMKVSHRPLRMTPESLQGELNSGYRRIYSWSRLFSMPTAREAAYQAMFSLAFGGWRKSLEDHKARLETQGNSTEDHKCPSLP